MAEVAELADALASGASDRKIIRVQLPSSALMSRTSFRGRKLNGKGVGETGVSPWWRPLESSGSKAQPRLGVASSETPFLGTSKKKYKNL